MISRNEVFLLVDKLCGSKRVRCRVSFAPLGLWIEGKLRRVGDRIFLESSALSLDLQISDDMEFEYVDASDVQGGEGRGNVVSSLGISFPLRLPIPTEAFVPRDKIIFLALDE